MSASGRNAELCLSASASSWPSPALELFSRRRLPAMSVRSVRPIVQPTSHIQFCESHSIGHFFPFLPVYGLKLPLVLQLFDLLESGAVRTCGVTYFTDLGATYPFTRTDPAKAEEESSRARQRVARMVWNDPALTPEAKLNAMTARPEGN